MLCEKQFTQALTYVNALKEPANRYHIRDNYLIKDIKRVKAICISPVFGEYQEGAENEQIVLVKITKYENGVHSFIRLESKYFGFPSDEKVKLEVYCQQLETNDWVKEKLKEIDNLVSGHTYKKEKIPGAWAEERYIVYEREEGKWLLLIRIGKKQFRVWFEDNEITKELDYEKDISFKNLRKYIICQQEESYQRCYKLLINYLNFIKTISAK